MKESKVLRGVVAALAIVACSLPAMANADLDGKAEKVNYADLNVEKEAGAKQLYRRLQHASKRVCGVESLTVIGSVREMSKARNCYRDSLDSAVAKVNSKALSKIHKG